MCEQCQHQEQQDEDNVRWLALVIRQGLKLIVAGIDAKYGESRSERERREREEAHHERRAA